VEDLHCKESWQRSDEQGQKEIRSLVTRGRALLIISHIRAERQALRVGMAPLALRIADARVIRPVTAAILQSIARLAVSRLARPIGTAAMATRILAPDALDVVVASELVLGARTRVSGQSHKSFSGTGLVTCRRVLELAGQISAECVLADGLAPLALDLGVASPGGGEAGAERQGVAALPLDRRGRHVQTSARITTNAPSAIVVRVAAVQVVILLAIVTKSGKRQQGRQQRQ